MSSQANELDLDMSNLSCQEEDPITRNIELLKMLLVHKFPGCVMLDYPNHKISPVTNKEYYIFEDFEFIINILDSSKFEALTEEAERRIKEYEYPDKTVKFALRPFGGAIKDTITYWFEILCD